MYGEWKKNHWEKKKDKNNINTPFLFFACLYWCFLFLARKDRSQLPWGFAQIIQLEVGAHGHAASRGLKKNSFPFIRLFVGAPERTPFDIKSIEVFFDIPSHIISYHRTSSDRLKPKKGAGREQ